MPTSPARELCAAATWWLPTPAAVHPDNAALEVLASILGDQPSGRLYKALVDNKKAVVAE